MMRKLCTTVTVCCLAGLPRLEAQSGAPASAIDTRTGIYDPSLDARVETLLRKMTLEEKVGQLVQYSAGQPTGPGTGRTDYDDMIAKGQIGALFNISTAKETNAFQRIAVEKSRLQIPIVFRAGCHPRFPHRISQSRWALASTWDPPLVEQAARVAAQRSFCNRDSLDVFSHGGYRPRRSLGPHGRRCRRRPVSRFSRWQLPMFGDIKVRDWMHRTASPPVPSISSDTERPRADAITTPLKSPSTRCGRSICRRFTPP